jgi:hypothetical protein
MKISHILCAAVLGATLVATTQTASAGRWYGGYHGGWGRGHASWYAPRAYYYNRPYAYAAPGYTYDPYYVAPAPVVVRPRPYVVVRPRPVVVRRGWYGYRRW